MVTVRTVLSPMGAVAPKDTGLDGLDSIGVLTPVAVSAPRATGPLSAFVAVTLSVPARAPVVDGVTFTRMMHIAFTASVAPQVLSALEYSAAAAPPMVMA